MDEHKLAERFCRDIDKILHGEEAQAMGPVPEEYRSCIELAKSLAEDDFGDECLFREKLRSRLLDIFTAHRTKHAGEDCGTEPGGAEIDDEKLQYVAGGVENVRKDSCSLCDCRLIAGAINGDTCPLCGHPRECHPL
ncbi:MAG TPA: hypothetical protein PK728_09615 [Bacillota bacterium]|nr:hypothetical protein [Bacillota bacterium]